MALAAPAAAIALIACALGATTASASTQTLGLGGWQVQSSAVAPDGGAAISDPGYAASGWLAVQPDDAGAVGTEINALLQNGACPNVFFSTNMKDCFGYMDRVGPVTIPQFAVPWWFRTTFDGTSLAGQHAWLIVNGVVGKADVWLNGAEVASQATVQGAFTRYTFDVTDKLRSGTNALAVEVVPNDPQSMLTLDDVDWNQIPPDNNTGIQFPIQLHTAQTLALSDAHVVQHDGWTARDAALTVKGVVKNTAATAQTGVVSATITPPAGGGAPITVQRTITLARHQLQTVTFTPSDDPRLQLHHPKRWWPYQLGDQPLYRLDMSVSSGGASDSSSQTFGVRVIRSFNIGKSPLAPVGARQFFVNGKPVLFRGGGFVPDLFLRYSSSDIADQIALMKNLGLNGIRTEGKQMPDDFYEQMDRAGLLIDAGFQCCDFWQPPPSGHGLKPIDYLTMENSARTIGQNLRNHPSVMKFGWSDNAPIPRQEEVSLRGFAQADFQVPIIASAEYKSSRKLPTSGMKEGPYDWVPPSYWYDTTHFDPGNTSRTNEGGAWAYDSESSAGHTVPTLDSIRRFMSADEQAALWQQPDFNQYHANYEPDLPGPQNFGYAFGTLHDLDLAIAHRYGPWSSLEQYVEEAQAQNYETQRAQFEAYIDHWVNKPTPSTGVVYWQLNKGWPTLLWALYNDDGDQAGSYFGAKKANEPLHVLYAYDNGTVAVSNFSRSDADRLTVAENVYALDGTLVDHQVRPRVDVARNSVRARLLHPRVPAAGSSPRTYFVELLLRQGGQIVDRNVYWLSTRPDLVNWAKTLGHPQATMIRYADLTALQGLPAASLRVTASSAPQAGPNGADRQTTVTIENASDKPVVGFLLRADVRRGQPDGTPLPGDNQVLPIAWSDNDITLWPGESQTLTAAYRSSDLQGTTPVVTVSGWNAPTTSVAAG